MTLPLLGSTSGNSLGNGKGDPYNEKGNAFKKAPLDFLLAHFPLLASCSAQDCSGL